MTTMILAPDNCFKINKQKTVISRSRSHLDYITGTSLRSSTFELSLNDIKKPGTRRSGGSRAFWQEEMHIQRVADHEHIMLYFYN